MADITMTVTQAIKAGILDVTAHANAKVGNAAGTDYFYFPNDGKTVLVVVGGAGAKAITFYPIGDKFGRTESLTVSVTASKTSVIGPFLPDIWNQGGNGFIKFQPAAGGLITDYYLALRVSNPT